ncbi:hypothetical protein [Microbispora bryophytorum]|uniref:hypothetical protein n=1 Tax=Microbispora bryophytorum TaxID=1460882 RepID=UPI003402905F
MGVSATLLHHAWVLWVPGVIGLVHLVCGKGVVLANIAGVVAVLGLINFSALMISDFFDIMAFQMLPADQAEKLLQDAAQPAMTIARQMPGMIGSFLGVVCLWPSRTPGEAGPGGGSQPACSSAPSSRCSARVGGILCSVSAARSSCWSSSASSVSR